MQHALYRCFSSSKKSVTSEIFTKTRVFTEMVLIKSSVEPIVSDLSLPCALHFTSIILMVSIIMKLYSA